MNSMKQLNSLFLKATLLACFLVTGNSWTQTFEEIFKAVADDRDIEDRSGYSVDISGDYAVIGTYGDDIGGPNVGSAYVYHKTGLSTWEFLQKLESSDGENYDRFGWSVAIHGDYIVVGAYGEDDDVDGLNSLSKAGSAYIYEKDGSGLFIEVQKIVASDRAIDDEFGWSVDIFENTIVIGAHTEDHNAVGTGYIYNAGSVYIFERDGAGVWSQTQKIVGSERAADLYYPSGGSEEDLSDLFGGTVAIWGDYLIVGSHHHDYGPGGGSAMWSSGAAYIFERDGTGTWTEVTMIQNADREPWDRFGYDVAIDSNIAVICAFSEDEAEDGISDPLTNPGSVYIFERDLGGTWSQIQKIVPDDRSSGDHFGASLDIDGDFMVLGTHSDDDDASVSDVKVDAGSAYIFQKDGSGFWSQYQKIDASDRDSLDEFGTSAAISGTTILVGAPFQKFDETGSLPIAEAGAGYFFSTEVCTPSFVTQDLTICSGNSITVGVNTYSTSGTFTDILLNSDGCDSTVTTNLSVTPPPSHTQTIELCFGETFSIGGSTYTSTGLYEDTLTTVAGCDSIVYTDLYIEPENAVTQDISICWGESYTIGASTYFTSGTYTDILTASTFCDSVITTNLTVELPVNVALTMSGNVITAAAIGASYQWMNCDTDAIIPGATNQTYAAPGLGNYAVIVTENGCTDTSACVYVATLNSINSEENFSIYPNPSTGKVKIEFPQVVENSNILVYNSTGQLIYKQEVFNTTIELDFNDYPKGTYLVKLVNNKHVFTNNLILY